MVCGLWSMVCCLWSVVYGLLSVVCCLLSVVCGLWSVVCGLWSMSVVCGLWSMVCGLWSMVCGLWSMVCGLWSVVYGLWSVCGLWSVVCGLWSVVCGQPVNQIRSFKHKPAYRPAIRSSHTIPIPPGNFSLFRTGKGLKISKKRKSKNPAPTETADTGTNKRQSICPKISSMTIFEGSGSPSERENRVEKTIAGKVSRATRLPRTIVS